jgi:hypothetical protein
MTPGIWEIWLAYVPYDQKRGGKPRPVIVIDARDGEFTAIELTSQPPKYEGEFILAGWQAAGLERVSTVKVYRFAHIYEEDFKFKIGDVALGDITAIIHNEVFQNTLKAPYQHIRPTRLPEVEKPAETETVKVSWWRRIWRRIRGKMEN